MNKKYEKCLSFILTRKILESVTTFNRLSEKVQESPCELLKFYVQLRMHGNPVSIRSIFLPFPLVSAVTFELVFAFISHCTSTIVLPLNPNT